MSYEGYGKIPLTMICRFGELTKTEIIVVSYLYGCRNDRTKRCNPSRKAISADTGIAKSHLSTALRSLEEAGWIAEMEGGSFDLFGDPPPREKVTESVTFREPKVTESVTFPADEVTESVTKVPESVTKVTKSVTPFKRNGTTKNNEGTAKGESVGALPSAPTPRAAPRTKGALIPDDFRVTDEMRDWAKLNVPDVEIATETRIFCNYWRTTTRNPYKRNWALTWETWMIREQRKAKEDKNGTHTNGNAGKFGRKRTDQEALAESADFYANYPG